MNNFGLSADEEICVVRNVTLSPITVAGSYFKMEQAKATELVSVWRANMSTICKNSLDNQTGKRDVFVEFSGST